MKEINQILALSKLLEFVSNRKYGVKSDKISFEDNIGEIALRINNDIKTKKGIDIFNPTISFEKIIKYEHILSNAISNFTQRKIITRNVNDEVNILLNSKAIPTSELSKFKIIVSKSTESFIEKVDGFTENDLLSNCLNAQFLSYLNAGKLNNQYFANTRIKLNDKDFILTTVLRHETRKADELSIIHFLVLNYETYSRFFNNPTQVFLKGLDKYGIDMKIRDEISRYYFQITVPIETNVSSFEFLDLKNIGKDDFIVVMSFKQTKKTIELANVFAINTTKFREDFNKNFA